MFYLKIFKHPLFSIVSFIDVFGPDQGGIPSPVKHFPEAMGFWLGSHIRPSWDPVPIRWKPGQEIPAGSLSLLFAMDAWSNRSAMNFCWPSRDSQKNHWGLLEANCHPKMSTNSWKTRWHNIRKLFWLWLCLVHGVRRKFRSWWGVVLKTPVISLMLQILVSEKWQGVF